MLGAIQRSVRTTLGLGREGRLVVDLIHYADIVGELAVRPLSLCRWCISGSAALAVAFAASGAVAQGFQQERPIPSTAQQSLTAIELLFSPPAPPSATLFPEWREKLKDAPAFFRDAKSDINFRSYYREQIGNAPGAAWPEAWAAGGSVSFESGRIFNLISGGVVFYTSLPLYAPADHGETGLLRPGQQGIAVVEQLTGSCISTTRRPSSPVGTSGTRPSSVRTTTG